MKAAENHGRVLKTPEPVILFTNFGDSALEFEDDIAIIAYNQLAVGLYATDGRRGHVVAVEEAARTGCATWVALTAGPDADLLSPIEMA